MIFYDFLYDFPDSWHCFAGGIVYLPLWKMMELLVRWDDEIPNWMESPSKIHMVPVTTNQKQYQPYSWSPGNLLDQPVKWRIPGFFQRTN